MKTLSPTILTDTNGGPKKLKLRLLSGYMPYVVSYAWKEVKTCVATQLTRLQTHWWGVRLDRGFKFYGMPRILRHPAARIAIGKNAVFRSAEWSSTIGLNRRCFLSAMRGASITIGDDCGFSSTVIAARASIQIGDRVFCGANCTIVDNDRHPLDACARVNREQVKPEPIVIEDDVWLCMNVMVLKGCHIGEGTVVSANSVVTHSLPENVLAGGIPARVLRELS